MSGRNPDRPLRRSVLIIAVVPVLVALMLVAWQPWLASPQQDPAFEGTTPLVLGSVPPSPVVEDDQPTDRTSPAPLVTAPVADEPVAAAELPSKPYRIVVLPARIDSEDFAAAAIIGRVQQAMMSTLHGMQNIDAVEVSAADLTAILPASSGRLQQDSLVYLAVSRTYAGRTVVELSIRSFPGVDESWQILADLIIESGAMGSQMSTLPKQGNSGSGKDPESIGVEIAESLAGRQKRPGLAEAVAAIIGAADTVRDTSKSERTRMTALSRLNIGDIDDEMVAIAMGIASQSEDSGARRVAISTLRRKVYDASLVPALSDVLFRDPDPGVRREAALALAAYVGQGSGPILQLASMNDVSADVRLTAQMSSMSFDERQAFIRERLLDRDLSPEERIAAVVINSSDLPLIRRGIFVNFGNDEAEEMRAYAEIVGTASDPAIRTRVLGEITQLIQAFRRPGFSNGSWVEIESEVVDVLIDSAADTNNNVRRGAVDALLKLVDRPDARALVERILEEDPALAAELRIPEALDRSTFRGGVLPVTNR